MACVLITDVPIIKALEGHNSKDFEALWDILKTGKVCGYITSNDLQQLEQYLYEFVGDAYAQKLLGGFRSVLGLYGDPDYPAVDLIIDGESVDELADEIPIRSVSDFLCIYELELLLVTGPGEEILTDSLFSSISEVIEVLDGDDAFVAKALIASIVPVEDAPLLENLPQLPLQEIRAIASPPTENEDTPIAGGAPVEQPLNSNAPSRTLLLSSVMQTILTSGTPAGPTKYDLRFESEQPNSLDQLKRRGMTLAPVDQATYSFNVDMFLILGLIMQMEPKHHPEKEENLNVHRALLTHKTRLFSSQRSNLNRPHPHLSAPSDNPILSTLFATNPAQTDSVSSLNPTDILVPLQKNQIYPFFYKKDGDRPFSLEFLIKPHSQQNTKSQKLAPETALFTNQSSPDANKAPRHLEGSPSANLHQGRPSPQNSTPLLSDVETQSSQSSSPFRQAPATILSRVSGASGSEMDSMLSGTLTSQMGADKRTTVFARSASSAQRLSHFLTSLQERAQGNTNRLAKVPQFVKEQSLFTFYSDQSDNQKSQAISDRFSSQSLIRFISSLKPLQNQLVSDSHNITDDESNNVISVDGQGKTIDDGDEREDINASGDLYYYYFNNREVGIIQIVNDSDINGGNGHDNIAVMGSHNTISGGRGNDEILHLEGANNTINGNSGDDTIGTIIANNTTINGGSGDDTIGTIIANNNTINGGSGDDDISTAGRNSTVDGGKDDDKIDVTGRNSTIDGGKGDDEISGYGSGSTIRGGKGDDEIDVTGINASIHGGNGDDEISIMSPQSCHKYGGIDDDEMPNFIHGGDGRDLIGVYSGVGIVTGGRDEDIFALYKHKPKHKYDQRAPSRIVITDFELEKDTLVLTRTTIGELSLKQVGSNTHIFGGNDLLAVLNSVDSNYLSMAEGPNFVNLNPSVFISLDII